jgi:hypothetical protein
MRLTSNDRSQFLGKPSRSRRHLSTARDERNYTQGRRQRLDEEEQAVRLHQELRKRARERRREDKRDERRRRLEKEEANAG